MKIKKIIRRITYLVLACAVVMSSGFITSIDSKAAQDTLKVKAGYFGLPFVTKKEYSLSEVKSLGVHNAQYTVISNGGFCAYSDIEGVYLSDVIEGAGIDLYSVKHLNFTATDEFGASKNFGFSTLFGGGKYAFPDLSKYYSKYEGLSEENEAIVWETATSVQTMLAIRDNYRRVGDYSEYEPSSLDDGHRFRLYIGQSYPTQNSASDTIYDIHTVIVTYEGSPEIIADSNVKVSIGEDKVLDVSVNSADSDISEMLESGLKYKSSDPSVLTVDANGKITPKKAGEAEITIYYESTDVDAADITKTVKVVVGEENGEGGGGGNSGSGLGDTDGDGDGSAQEGKNPESDNSSGKGNNQTNKEESDSSSTNKNPVSDKKPVTNKTETTSKPEDSAEPEEITESEEITVPEEIIESEVLIEQEEEVSEEIYITEQEQTKPVTGSLKVRKVYMKTQQATVSQEAEEESSSGMAGGSEALGVKLGMHWMVLIGILLLCAGGFGMYIQFKKSI